MAKYEKKRLKEQAKRIQYAKDCQNSQATHYYILKRGVYYRPNSCGYTDCRHRAGVYSKEEAISEYLACDELGIRPVDISEHNMIVQKEIDHLQSLLIKESAPAPVTGIL